MLSNASNDLSDQTEHGKNGDLQESVAYDGIDNETRIIEERRSALEECLAELDSLIGLDSVKSEIITLTHTIAINNQRKAANLSVPDFSNHLVFYGNPGTGKTTVARIVAKIYQVLGVISKGHLVETDRSGLVAGYVGQTALKTKKVVDDALGGVLFIDEAYTLAPEGVDNDFGQETIDTLLKAMEDNRKDLVVIVAGYPRLMRNFIKSNPGLESRFNKYILFPDYSPEELEKIFLMMCAKYDYQIDPELQPRLIGFFRDMVKNKTENFANAREIRNLFERTIQRQASRLYVNKVKDKIDMTTIMMEDFFDTGDSVGNTIILPE